MAPAAQYKENLYNRASPEEKQANRPSGEGNALPLARFAGLLLKGSVSLDSQSPKGSLQHGYHRLTGFSGRFRSPTNPVRWCDSSSLATPQVVAEQSSAKRLSHKWHKAQHGLLCPRTAGWQGNTIRRGAQRPENRVTRFTPWRRWCRRHQRGEKPLRRPCIGSSSQPKLALSLPIKGPSF